MEEKQSYTLLRSQFRRTQSQISIPPQTGDAWMRSPASPLCIPIPLPEPTEPLWYSFAPIRLPARQELRIPLDSPGWIQGNKSPREHPQQLLTLYQRQRRLRRPGHLRQNLIRMVYKPRPEVPIHNRVPFRILRPTSPDGQMKRMPELPHDLRHCGFYHRKRTQNRVLNPGHIISPLRLMTRPDHPGNRKPAGIRNHIEQKPVLHMPIMRRRRLRQRNRLRNILTFDFELLGRGEFPNHILPQDPLFLNMIREPGIPQRRETFVKNLSHNPLPVARQEFPLRIHIPRDHLQSHPPCVLDNLRPGALSRRI